MCTCYEAAKPDGRSVAKEEVAVVVRVPAALRHRPRHVPAEEAQLRVWEARAGSRDSDCGCVGHHNLQAFSLSSEQYCRTTEYQSMVPHTYWQL